MRIVSNRLRNRAVFYSEAFYKAFSYVACTVMSFEHADFENVVFRIGVKIAVYRNHRDDFFFGNGFAAAYSDRSYIYVAVRLDFEIFFGKVI